MATCGYDDDGVKTTSFPIIKDGMFVDYQTTRDQAHLIGQKASHGCSYADNWSSIPFQRMPNVSLQPGEKDVTEQDIIGATDDGIFDQGDGSYSIDHQRYNFQFSGQTFWEVKNGKITTQLRDLAYQSNTPEFWKSLRHAGRPVHLSARAARSTTARASRGRATRSATAARSRDSPGEHAQYRTVDGRRHDLDTGTGEGADRPRAVVQQGRRNVRGCSTAAIARTSGSRGTRATTSGASSGYSLAITAASASRSGTVTTVGVRRCQPAARGAERRGDRPALAGQSRGDAGRSVRRRLRPVNGVLRRCRHGVARLARRVGARPRSTLSKQKEVVSAGFVETSAQMQAVAKSKGLFGYDRFTAADYNLTARTPDGTGSGWASKSFNELRQLEPAKLAASAIDKAALSKNPAAIEPGKYTVVLEPAALADLLAFLHLHRRRAPGRRRTQLLFEERRRHADRRAGARREGPDLLGSRAPARAVARVRRRRTSDRPQRLGRQRCDEGPDLLALLGAEAGEGTDRRPANIIMDGGTATMADLIAGTRARDSGDALLVYPLARSADAPAHRADARRACS